MKLKISECKGELPSYLTIGKEYEVIKDNGYGVFTCRSDDGFLFDASTQAPSDRLNGGNWEVVKE